MASCILLYSPSHSYFLLCNVIVILLQCIILYHCIIFVIHSSCCFSLSLDMLCRAQGLLCSVQESTWEIEIQMWQQTSPGLARMVLITNSWAQHLSLLCLHCSFDWDEKMKMQAMCRCLSTWSNLENVRIKLCSSEPDVEVMQRQLVAVVENFWINQEDWLEVSVLFLLRKVQRENVFAYFKEVRRWGRREVPAKVPVDVCSLWNREKQRALPYFSPPSPFSNTLAFYQLALRTKCAQGKEIKIAKRFSFLSTELTEKWQNACGND